ncbi:MAG: aldehyde dehydrogenase family protein [Dongiaceae bacterium]
MDRADVAALPNRMLIGGRLVAAGDGQRMTTVDPACNRPLADVPDAGPADIEAAVEAARQAFPAWSGTPLPERQQAIRAVAELLRRESETLGALDSFDTGNVFSAMRQDSAIAADCVDYLCNLASAVTGTVTQLDRHLHYTKRVPFGVVARLLPFNHPAQALGISLAAPLLAGNCLVVKPSPHSPLSGLWLAERLAGLLPPGVVNIVTGSNERASAALIAHPGVSRISVVGSVEAGRLVMRQAAERIVPVSLELGGKNPLIVLPDADLGKAAKLAMDGMNFRWQSHSCAATSVIYVPRQREKAYVEALAELAGALRVAPPFDPAAEMGAISTAALLERTLAYVAEGEREGARLVCGGRRLGDPERAAGNFVAPALFAGAEPGMRIAREEIFGPVMTVIAYDDLDDVVEQVNRSPLGLCAVLATDQLTLTHQICDRLAVGYVEVNGPISFALGQPYGGFRQSGFGREGSIDEIESYTQLKSVNIRLA